MAEKLTGSLNLSRIPKGCITTKANGDKCIWIDVLRKKAVDGYGNTHMVTLYDKEKRETVYLADLKRQEFGSKDAAAQQSGAQHFRERFQPTPSTEQPKEQPKEQGDDLPF